jgi:2-deoxy-D-gluconate 3-dehydrogenase
MSTSIRELFDLSGQAAVVTGAARGIGEGIARRLAEAGAAVLITDTELELGERVAKSIRETGATAHAFRADAAIDADAVINRASQLFGRLDLLVNNAGVFPFSSFLETSETLWDQVLGLNLKGPFLHAQAAARLMREQQRGNIINIASIDGLHPTGRLAHYDASKGGLLMLTRSLALELAPFNIRVNSICPGAVMTPGARAVMEEMGSVERVATGLAEQVPLRRLGEPDDIAGAVLFLASKASSYVTGSTLVVDGGFLLT